MATDINDLINTDTGDLSIDLNPNPTISIFGREIDRDSFFVYFFELLTIIFVTYLLNKSYGIFTDNKICLGIFIYFIVYCLFNIFFSSTQSGDIAFEQLKLEHSQDNLVFMIGIITVIIMFFINITKYTSNDKVILQLLIVVFIINIICVMNINVKQESHVIRIVRKVKEACYNLITYFLVILFVYGFISKLAKKGEEL